MELLDVHAHDDKLLFRTWQLYESEGLVGDRLRLGSAHCHTSALPEACKDWLALSFTGGMIFESACMAVHHSFMSPLLETFLSKFKKLTVWDEAAVKKCKDEFDRDALTKHNTDIYEIWWRARCHKIDYSGIMYVVVCFSWNQLFNLQVHGFISNVAVHLGSLLPSVADKELINAQCDYAATHVAEELLRPNREPRRSRRTF